MTTSPLADRVAFALDAAGFDAVAAVNFDQVTKAGWKVRADRSDAVYVYAELPRVSADQQAELKSAASKSAASWLAISAYIGGERQMEVDDLLIAYATALRAEGFTVDPLDLGGVRARLRVTPCRLDDEEQS